MTTDRAWVRLSLRVFLWALVLVAAGLLAVKIWGERLLAREAESTQASMGRLVRPLSPPRADEVEASTWLRAGTGAVVLFGDQEARLWGLFSTPSWTPEQRSFAGELLAQNAASLSLLHRGLDAKPLDPAPRIPLGEGVDRSPELHALFLLALEGRVAIERGDWPGAHGALRALGVFSGGAETTDDWDAYLSPYGTRVLLRNLELAQRTLPLDSAQVEALAALVPTRDRSADWARLCKKNWSLIVNWDSASPTRLEALRAAGFGASFRAWLWRDFRGAALVAYYAAAAPRLSEPLGLSPGAWPQGVWPSKVPFAGDVLETWGLTPGAAFYQADLSARRLARVALRLRAEGLREGRYPDSLAGIPEAATPDPLTGGGLSYTRRPDGSARLEVGGAQEVLKRVGSRLKCAAAWELPAPRR